MSTAAAPAPAQFITAEEYLHLACSDRPSELMRGSVVVTNPPFSNHGYWCNRMVRFLGRFVADRQLGRILINDSGVVTEREPDTVRGADIAYYSYQRVPKDAQPSVTGAFRNSCAKCARPTIDGSRSLRN